MYPEEQKLLDIELKVGLLNKDVEQTTELCDKLSESIEKIQEMNTTMIRMITIHEQRHEHTETVKTEMKEDIKELHSRITTITRELHERIDQVEKHITSRIDALRSDLANHKKSDADEPISEKLADKLITMEQWKWMLMGGVAFASFLLGHSDILGKLFR
jgi:DNA repair exonuclease SbcCD ATPase subunit